MDYTSNHFHKSIFIVFCSLIIVQSQPNYNDEKTDPTILDPRKNSSYYDLKISGTLNNQQTVIGQIDTMLLEKQKINQTTMVYNYKLIYYSPLLVSYNSFSRSMYSPSKLTEDLFSIDVKNGQIKINTPVDIPILEYLCQNRQLCSCDSCIFTLNFIYSTANKINSDTIRVFVDDKNEQGPVFVERVPLVLNISEASQIGHVFKVAGFNATDSDAYYNKISYFVSDRDVNEHEDGYDVTGLRATLFEISGVDEYGVLSLVLKKHLDYETVNTYQLFIIATDNGSPNPLFASKTLTVNIIDENDNSPLCGESLFLVNINENHNHSNFLQIKASDRDSALNSKLEYFILSHLNDVNLFSIDPATGWISLKEPLDYEKKSFYELTIEVRDCGEKKVMKTRCAARVNVIDLNDNPAKIKIIEYLDESKQTGFYAFNTVSSASDNDREFNKIQVYENNDPGLVLALIKVFDSDELSNYKFSISPAVYDQDNISMFKIQMRSSREFELITMGTFDAEKTQNYRLKLVLYDLQTIGKTNSTRTKSYFQSTGSFFQINIIVNIQVLDRNDNGPKFVQQVYNFSLQENRFNVKLPPIYVLDKDINKNSSRLEFKLSSANAANYIYLFYEQNILNLVIQAGFDYEGDGPFVEFNILVIDESNRTDSCHVRLNLVDQNDNTPQFMNGNATFELRENGEPFSFVGQVVAVDRDAPGINSDISFRILGSDYLKSLFKIYKSGMIFSNMLVFDRETQDQYTLQIEAYNAVDNTSSIANYTIKITDENDNRPYFIYPGENLKYLNIYKLDSCSKRSNCSMRIFTVRAGDKDISLNGQVVYFIQDNMSMLTIDDTNGDVFIQPGVLATGVKRVIDVCLSLQDLGKPRLESTMNFTIYLNFDKNEIPEAVLMSIDESDSSNNTSPTNNREHLTKNKSLNNISKDLFIIGALALLLFFMILITCYVLVSVFRRTKCCFNSNTRVCKKFFVGSPNNLDHSLTVKDASTNDFTKSITCTTNPTTVTDLNLSLQPNLDFTSNLKISSVFDPDYLNDFYSKILFKASTNDLFDASQKSDSDISIDILGELYEDSKKFKNYENIEFTGRVYGETFSNQTNALINDKYKDLKSRDPSTMKKFDSSYLNDRPNLETLNSYIYSLPMLNETKFPSSKKLLNSQPEFTTLEPNSNSLQAENQILLDSSKSSSDQMLKNLLEKFEIIYNDSVIQNKNLSNQLTQIDRNETRTEENLIN